MKVLVTVGSKHGSTDEIGRAVATALQEHDIEVDVRAPDQVTSLDEYGAVVIGSAIYAGRWTADVKRFVEANAEALRHRPVWAFSSGPIGNPPKPVESPPDGVAASEQVKALDHRVFAGALDRSKLGLGERAIVGLLKAPDGDFRDWDTIRDWSADIARSLRS